MNKLCYLTSALFAAITQACVQVELESIANTNGKITDYLSDEDEIIARMGVDEYVYILWEGDIRKWATKRFNPNVVTLTCFHDSVFWI